MSNVEIQWVEDGTPAQKPFRAFVIGWQNSRYAINRQIESYNALTLPAKKRTEHEEMQVAAVRRHIVSSMVELREKLDQKYGHFRRDGIPTAPIDGVRNGHRADLDRAESWRAVRNLTFHFGDIVATDIDLVATYNSILQITDAEVNSVWVAIVTVGEAMKQLALERT
jgi:hypothetical protein